MPDDDEKAEVTEQEKVCEHKATYLRQKQIDGKQVEVCKNCGWVRYVGSYWVPEEINVVL